MNDTQPDMKSAHGRMPAELLVWMSPAFPTGAFAYSQGLETAVTQGWVSNAENLQSWMEMSCLHGALRNDLILMSLVMRSDSDPQIQELADLSAALQPSAERAQETLDQGRSFWTAYREAWRPKQHRAMDDIIPDNSMTLPVAVALAASEHAIAADGALESYAIAFASNQISAAIRLGVIGQVGGQRVIADLMPNLRRLSEQAVSATEADLGSATYGVDLACILHETQTTRLFRS